MSSGPAWLRQSLLLLAVMAVLVGAFELRQLATGRRRTLPGLGWETEITHLVMNAFMAAMMTAFWSRVIALGGAVALGASALLLIIAPALRPSPPVAERRLVAIATAIHVAAALLMAWLVVRMAPSPAHAMTMPHRLGTRTWLEWLCAAFFMFDLASVALVTILSDRLPDRLRGDTPKISVVPHVAMDIGMVAMLAFL